MDTWGFFFADADDVMTRPVWLVCRACHSALSVRMSRLNSLDGDCAGYYQRDDRLYTLAGQAFSCENKESLPTAPEEAPRCAELEAGLYGSEADLAQAIRRLEAETWPARKLKYWLRAAIGSG